MKRFVSGLLLAGLCFGVNTVQAEGLWDAPFPEVQQAAEQGDVDAQYILAQKYELGEGVAQDYRQAVTWYRKAAEQGDSSAQYHLASMYDNGQGVAQDYRQAVTWYRKAAEQGHSIARYNLALRYAKGQGVAQDYKMAYVWLSVSAAHGDVDTAEIRDKYAKLLTPEVLADAQTLAGQYFEKYQSKK